MFHVHANKLTTIQTFMAQIERCRKEMSQHLCIIVIENVVRSVGTCVPAKP